MVRPGGTVGMTAWTREGYTAELFALSRSYAPPSDQPLSDEWSVEETVRERFDGLAARFEVEMRELVWEAESVERLMEMIERRLAAVGGRRSRTCPRSATTR